MSETETQPFDLSHFTGTMQYHITTLFRERFLATDGMLYIANNGGGQGAFWLHTAVASHQSENLRNKCEGFQLWRLKKDGEQGAVLECFTDSPLNDENLVVRQEIGYTDFAFDRLGSDEFEFYAIGGFTKENPLIILLKSEY